MHLGNNVAAANICPGLYLFNQCGADVPIVKQWPTFIVICVICEICGLN
jgi:hypothetical protein